VVFLALVFLLDRPPQFRIDFVQGLAGIEHLIDLAPPRRRHISMQSLAFGPRERHGSISGRVPLRFVTLSETRFHYSFATPLYIEGNFQVSHPTLRVMALASLVAIVGCHRQADAPGDAPGNLQVESGEGRVTLRWDQQPGLTYWIFFQAGASVTAAAPGVPLIFDVQSPRVVAGLANLANDTQYAFVMNATNQDSKAGPSTPVVLGSTRLAGKIWTPGAPLAPQNLNGVALATVVVSGIGTSRLVAVGDAGTLLAGDLNYTSTNPPGVTAWTQATSVPTGFVSNLRAVTSDLSQFIALGSDGSIVTSADGNTWTSKAAVPNNGRMNSLVFGLSASGTAIYVAVGDGGKIFTSPDLTAWTQATSHTTSELFNVSFPKDIFVATGASGALLTSPDGNTWTVQTSNTPFALRGTAFGTGAAGASYVVVGDAGTVLTSINGTDWIPATTPPPASLSLRSVAFGSRFVAVGVGGAVSFSDDGATWQLPSVGPGPSDLNSVVFTPAMYVAVGEAGANAVSK